VANLASRIAIPDDVLFRDLEGEAVILSTESGRYYGLDEVGTRMWNLLSQHGQIEPVYQALLAEYDVAEDRLQQDLLDLVDKLAAEGLLQVDGPQDS
jgi:hypothetical protein